MRPIVDQAEFDSLRSRAETLLRVGVRLRQGALARPPAASIIVGADELLDRDGIVAAASLLPDEASCVLMLWARGEDLTKACHFHREALDWLPALEFSTDDVLDDIISWETAGGIESFEQRFEEYVLLPSTGQWIALGERYDDLAVVAVFNDPLVAPLTRAFRNFEPLTPGEASAFLHDWSKVEVPEALFIEHYRIWSDGPATLTLPPEVPEEAPVDAGSRPPRVAAILQNTRPIWKRRRG